MKYTVGMKLKFVPEDKALKASEVTVEGMRKGGSAKLSNGWLADAFGYCEGNATQKGARVVFPDAEVPAPSKMKARRTKRGANE